MITESFTDEYGNKFTARKIEGHTNIQLLITGRDYLEPFSYGFAPNDFKRFAKLLLRVDEALARDTTPDDAERKGRRSDLSSEPVPEDAVTPEQVPQGENDSLKAMLP